MKPDSQLNTVLNDEIGIKKVNLKKIWASWINLPNP
jgi:hypothetical protein